VCQLGKYYTTDCSYILIIMSHKNIITSHFLLALKAISPGDVGGLKIIFRFMPTDFKTSG